VEGLIALPYDCIGLWLMGCNWACFELWGRGSILLKELVRGYGGS